MTVYVCCADDRTTHIEAIAFDAAPRASYVEKDFRASPERVAATWRPLSLEIHGLRRKGAVVQDVYMSGAVDGIRLYVSQRCRDVVNAAFPGQCTYLPVDLKRADSSFFALWVNQVREDALDKAQSDLMEDRFGTKHLTQYVFQEDRLKGVGIFRLPPAYAGMWDLVTEAFVEVVREAGLVGFSYWDRSRKS